MGTELNERALGNVLAKLVEGKGVEATAVLAGALLTLVSAGLLGPGAIVAGMVTEAGIKRFAGMVADNAIKRCLEAGNKIDDERAAMAELRAAVSSSLEQDFTNQAALIEELGLQNQEQFLQLINFTRRNVVGKLDLLLEQTATTHEAASRHEREQ